MKLTELRIWMQVGRLKTSCFWIVDIDTKAALWIDTVRGLAARKVNFADAPSQILGQIHDQRISR
jgi:hypothetical protein